MKKNKHKYINDEPHRINPTIGRILTQYESSNGRYINIKKGNSSD